MKTHKIWLLTLFILAFTAFHCRKKVAADCQWLLQPQADFAFKEVLSDTAFFADTVFADNPVQFTTLRPYKEETWKIGVDPREFTNSSFSLVFSPFLGSINVQFTARNDPNPLCFPGDSGIYKGTRSLTIVEQVDRGALTISPLTGRYRGSFNNTPGDSFTVRLEYFDSAKYSPLLGMRNFYWISNIPQGYTNLSNAGIFPELKNGMIPEMGYKCFSFGNAGDIISGKGHGELVGELLKIYYSHPQTGRKIFTGKRVL